MLQGFVKSTSKKGCFISLAPQVDAIVLTCNLSKAFVKDPAESFPPGKLIKGRYAFLLKRLKSIVSMFS